MDVRNCKGCSRLFNYLGGPQMCPECTRALDIKFEEVREYVYDNPGAGMQQVSEAMDVSIQQIKHWIREERLAFSDQAQVGLECENCGTMIRTGRFCQECKNKYANGFSSLYKPAEKSAPKKDLRQNPKMRFLDKQ